MESKRILVIGDAILDRHVYGSSSRLSPEAPVPVVDVESEYYTLGGAANVAAQIAAWGDPTFLLYKSFLKDSDDGNDKVLRNKLAYANISFSRLWTSFPGPTTVKTRVWSGNQQVVRFDKENNISPAPVERINWLVTIKDCIIKDSITTVVFADYNKGTLNDEFIQLIVDICNELGVETILDPKRPTFTNIRGLSIVKPNEVEVKNVGIDPESISLVMPDTYVVNTRGKKSTLVFHNTLYLGHSSTSDKEVVDVCGAGDVHCAVLALTFNGDNIMSAVEKANQAASASILHRGCYNLSRVELQEIIQ